MGYTERRGGMNVTGIGARVPRQGNAFTRWPRSFIGYKKHLALSLMFVPVIVYFVIFKYIPMGGIVIAFKNFKISVFLSQKKV